jgi:hypothetical protein
MGYGNLDAIHKVFMDLYALWAGGQQVQLSIASVSLVVAKQAFPQGPSSDSITFSFPISPLLSFFSLLI